MKRLLIVFLMSLLVFGIAEGRKKNKSGKVKDQVFTDAVYPFKWQLNDDWKHGLKKKDSNVRLILTKKDYDIPMRYSHAPNYTTVPKITVYVDTTSWPLNIFVDSLFSDNYKSDQKKDILSEFPVMFGDYKVKKKNKIKIGETDAMRHILQSQYTISVQGQGSDSDRGTIETDFHGGIVISAKHGDNIYLVHFIGEWDYFESLQKDFTKLIEGMEFTEK